MPEPRIKAEPCNVCNKGFLIEKEKKYVAGSLYYMYECDKCKRKVAKRGE